MAGRILAIGDVHGCLTALSTLLERLQPDAQDLIVFLGDYVDRGPDTRGVIDRILALRESYQVVTLRGNHEVMMLAARRDLSARVSWLGFGGVEAMDSYGALTPDDIPPEHWAFLETTLPYHETETEIFVHAGLDPDLLTADQPDEALFWMRFVDPQPHGSGKRLICGHTAQPSGLPDDRSHSVCIDTHAYAGQWLTCLDVATNHYWQANESGELREGDL